jgi:hypothetical protein
MDKEIFEERASRLEEVGKVINKLPSEIRLEAFGLLKGYVTKNAATGAAAEPKEGAGGDGDGGGTGDGGLFSKHIHDKPADNVYLIAADFFQNYGSAPFTAAEIEAAAADAGVTVPSSVDMTLRAAQKKGNKLFQSAGRGKFKTTVHGELFLKNTYNVKKGTKTRPKAEA